MANLVNCPGCGSRERPNDVSLVFGGYFCEGCIERGFDLFDDRRNAEGYFTHLAHNPHWPHDITGAPMTLADMEAWGIDPAHYKEAHRV
jgi:hypothetical protein